MKNKTTTNLNNDINKKEIGVGSIVSWKSEGFMRVKTVFKGKQVATLCGVFNGSIYFRNVPISELTEASDAFYKSWEQSDSYKSM